MIEIISFEQKYASVFKELNLYWLELYHLTEQPDLDVLDNPVGTIIESGGYIFLAKADDEIVGSAAIIKEHDNVYELAKMAVKPAFQGKGISKLLIEKCMAKAAEIGAERLLLYSNSQLKTALKLYEKYGFVYVPVTGSPFATADIKMELVLS